jgi:decaprenylphospho-beta-D-ribofuranose 2-oxidase
MGLTGVILSATLALRRVAGAMLAVDTERARSLDAVFGLLDATGGEHRVAWLDLLSGREPRGIVTRAAHCDATLGSPAEVTRPSRATVPSRWPGGLLRTEAVRAHNELRFRLAPQCERGRIEPFGAHMFPLDVLENWPRLYGPTGFLQYQLVVPRDEDRAVRAVIDRLARARVPCYLAVLKDFGPAGSGLLSFPLAGWTLALDIPRGAPGVDAVLDDCDRTVAAAGGRVYLSKDARLGAELTQAMYPQLGEWQAVRGRLDPTGLWRSDLAARTGLLDGEWR